MCKQRKNKKMKLNKRTKKVIYSVVTAISFGVTAALLNHNAIREKISKISKILKDNKSTKKA